MDIEWGKDGEDGRLYILQARPETVESRAESQKVERYELAARGDVIVEGRSIGRRIGAGRARLVLDLCEMSKIEPGDVLVSMSSGAFEGLPQRLLERLEEAA